MLPTKKKIAAKPRKKKLAEKIDFDKEIANLQTLLRALGEEAIMMRNGGKLAEKEKTYFGDIVTEADKLVEREIIKHIHATHPGHCVRGEEGAANCMGESHYEWIVNPIDGTTNFSKGLDFFSIAIAVLEEGVPKMGLIYFPMFARFIYATKGGGVFENGQPLKVFERPPATMMRQALIAGATTGRKGGREPILWAIRSKAMNLLNSGSSTFNGILLAERKLDAFIHTDATLFNVAAMIPIIEESGGVVAGIEKDYPDLTEEHIPIIFAANAKLMADIKQHIAPHWKSAEK